MLITIPRPANKNRTNELVCKYCCWGLFQRQIYNCNNELTSTNIMNHHHQSELNKLHCIHVKVNLKIGVFYTLFIVASPYHDRKHVFHIVPQHRCWHQGLIGGVEKPCYRRKTPLVLDGTRTRVLADSMTIAASQLDHCATQIWFLSREY